jgi:hypothetical protein
MDWRGVPNKQWATARGDATTKRNARRVSNIFAVAGPGASRLSATAIYDQLGCDEDCPAADFINRAKRQVAILHSRLWLHHKIIY